MDLNRAIEILEQVIDETSDEKVKRALDASHEKLVKQMRSFTGVEPEDVRKDNKLQAMAKKRCASEALSIVEEMLSLANSIFEADPQSPEGVEGVPPSTNQIKQTKKDKETGKKTEVVSVADELFPYEGNAKQQMNQKILAKINDMIEGTATLEDLLQLVRKNTKKPVSVKESFDIFERKLYNEKRELAILEDIINELKDSTLRIAFKKARDIKAEQEKVKNDDAVDKEFTEDQIAKREHQANSIEDHYEGQVAKRAENEQKFKKRKNKRS